MPDIDTSFVCNVAALVDLCEATKTSFDDISCTFSAAMVEEEVANGHFNREQSADIHFAAGYLQATANLRGLTWAALLHEHFG